MVAMNAWRQGAIALGLLSLLLSPTSRGDDDEGYLRAYKDGRNAIENRQWDLAIQKMRQALEGRSDEKATLFKAAYFRPYLPHYYLGVALFELGDCTGALASWAESERQGVVSRRDVYEDLKRSRSQCQAQAGSGEGGASPEPQPPEPELETAREAAPQPPPKPRAKAPPSRPSGRQERSAVAQELERLLPEVERLLEQVDPGASQAPEVQQLRTELVRLKEQAEQPARGASGRELERRLADLERSYDRFRRVVDRPPAELELAAQALLDGDYSRVLLLLSELASEEKRTEAHAHLLRSAALFASSRIHDDGELLTQAHDAARAALVADPDLAVPERLFSPRFRELFEAPDESDQED